MADDGDGRFLSDDVTIQILLFLPARSLVRFKSVCKTWYSLIQNPNFISNHFNHSNNQNRLLAVHSNDHTDYTFTVFLDESLSVQENINNPLISNGLLASNIRKILGPAKGIYLILWKYSETEDSIALWNPSTFEFRRLGHPFLPCKFSWFVGFGSSDNDIKLVCLLDYQIPCCMLLYSLAEDRWRRIKMDTYLLDVVYRTEYYDNFFTNLKGSYYWLLFCEGYHVFMFDARTEVFRDVPLPVECVSEKWRINGIFVLDERIVLLVTQISSRDRVDIWEMKEEGCWNKILSFVPAIAYETPLGLWKNDEIICRASFQEMNEVLLYNIASSEVRNLEVNGSVGVFDYKESLTSLKGL